MQQNPEFHLPWISGWVEFRACHKDPKVFGHQKYVAFLSDQEPDIDRWYDDKNSNTYALTMSRGS